MAFREDPVLSLKSKTLDQKVITAGQITICHFSHAATAIPVTANTAPDQHLRSTRQVCQQGRVRFQAEVFVEAGEDFAEVDGAAGDGGGVAVGPANHLAGAKASSGE